MGIAASMSGSGSYREVCDDLTSVFLSYDKVPLETRPTVRMVGLLFARPQTAFAAAEIVPSLRYYHHRSGRHINFYCAGFHPQWSLSRLDQGKELELYYDHEFDAFRREIEVRTKWRYSGGSDLLLTNARFDGARARLDFASAISADLVKMKAEEAVSSVDSFFEAIFHYSEHQDGKDPTWGFSNGLGNQIGGSALKHLLISLLPKGLQADAKSAFHAVVSDISLSEVD